MSDTPIDSLIIDIEAKASDADKAIDKFATAIGNLANSLAKVDTGKLNSVGNGIQRLSTSLQSMKSIDTRSINSVVSKINSLSTIDTSQFATVSANLHQMANGIASLGTVSANVTSVGELAKNISKLGNKSVQTAVTNIPQLATALDGLMTTLSNAPRVSQNVIQMTNALANLSSQGSKVGSASNSIVRGLNRTGTAAERSRDKFKGLASALGKFYANCFIAIRGVKSLWNSINSTADYLEAFNYFEVALNKVGGDWASDWEKYSEKLGVTSAEEYANSFKTRLNESLSGLSGVQISIDANGETGLLTDTGMKNLGLNIQEVTQYASQLASVTNSVGQTGEVTLATASAFTKLGADMSSLFNTDYSTVMNNLQSGLIGQSRALYKYGIDITNATLQTYAYELGVEKAVSEMTQAEKMQLRMIAILDQSRISWGDQSNTINSLSNSIRQFKNNISEAGQILGQLFVPIMSKIMPIVNGVTIAIKRLMVSIAGLMGIKLDLSEFGQGTSDITDDMDGLTDSLDDVTESAKQAKAGLRGFDELNVISTSSDSGSDTSTGTSGSVDLTSDILKATEEYEKAWQEAYDRMENEAIAFADRIEKALEPVKKIFEDFAVGDFFQAGQDVSNLVVSITDFFARAIDNVDWYGIGTKIGDFLAGIEWTDVLSSIGNLIWQVIKASIELHSGMFDAAPIETTIIAAIALLKWTGLGSAIFKGVSKSILSGTLFKDLGTLISGGLLEKSGIIAKLADVFALTFGGAGTLSESFMAVFGTVGTVIAGIGSIIAGAITAVASFFSMWKNGFSWLKEILMVLGTAIAAVGAVILGIATGPIAAVVAAVVAAVATIAIVVHDNWEAICEWFSGVGEWFNTNVIQPVADFFQGLWVTVSGFFVSLWEDITSVWNSVSAWFSENVIEPVVNFFVGFATRVQQIFEGLWIIIQAVWKVVSEWFNTNVIEPVANLFNLLWEGIKSVWSTVSSWFNSNVIVPITNIFKGLWESVSGFFTSLWSEIKSVWNNVSSWFNQKIITPVSNAFKTACDKIGGFFTSLWSGIKKGVASAMNAVIGGIEKAINGIVSGINGIIGGFNKIVTVAAKIVGADWSGVSKLSEVSLGRISVSAYENGGFVTPNLPNKYSLFMAGEYGVPEMLGTVGGKSAVVGGAEITGISDTIRATSNEEIALLRQQNSLLQAILEKEFGISQNDIGKAAQNYARDYSRRTGREAYSF